LTPPAASAPAASTEWRTAIPVVTAAAFTLRELRLSDAASLVTLLTTEEVTRFISPPPTTVDGFERFILWTHRERAAGNYVCFGVVPEGCNAAVGLFQIRQLEPEFRTAEWGFALGRPYWGTGLFAEGASRVLEFAFEAIGVHRLEARAAVQNGRGNGALEKMGATREGVLHKSFLRDGEYLDQILWSISDDDWRRSRVQTGASVQ
jgi:RimJ/RimL family protein N-acetyltransferase